MNSIPYNKCHIIINSDCNSYDNNISIRYMYKIYGIKLYIVFPIL